MRLQKYLSNLGFCSRQEAEASIRAGKIVVDGKTAALGDKVSGTEEILIDGHILKPGKVAAKKVLLFNKPGGVECTLSPLAGKQTLLDFDFGPDRVFPIGHLGGEVHGLLLLTNDGELGNRLSQPANRLEEEYVLDVVGRTSAETIARLEREAMSESRKTVRCRIERLQDNQLRCILYGGRTREIRRMCEAVGVWVRGIQRIRIGDIQLDHQLTGTWRVLTEKELDTLRTKKR